MTLPNVLPSPKIVNVLYIFHNRFLRSVICPSCYYYKCYLLLPMIYMFNYVPTVICYYHRVLLTFVLLCCMLFPYSCFAGSPSKMNNKMGDRV